MEAFDRDPDRTDLRTHFMPGWSQVALLSLVVLALLVISVRVLAQQS